MQQINQSDQNNCTGVVLEIIGRCLDVKCIINTLNKFVGVSNISKSDNTINFECNNLKYSVEFDEYGVTVIHHINPPDVKIIDFSINIGDSDE